MKLGCVITATNDNELYCDFIPIFIETYKKLLPDVLVRIIYVGEEIPEKFKEYKEYLILYTPASWLSTAFVSQYIRLLYPALLKIDGGIMITDMDMLPMNAKYYIDNIKDVSDDKFFCYRDALHTEGGGELPMCYNVALHTTWSNIFKINTLQDLDQTLIEVYEKIEYEDRHAGKGWGTDQNHLFLSVMKENNRLNNNLFIYKEDKKSGYKRLDRDDINSKTLPKTVIDNIKNHEYTDYHLNRPMSKYEKLNWRIFSLL